MHACRSTLEDPTSLVVRVVDEGGQPVRDVRVFSAEEDCGTKPLGTTDGEGRVTSAAIEAPFTLVACGADIQTREMLVEWKSLLVRMVVRRGASLSGRVVRSGSGQAPGAGARVVAWPNAWRIAPRELARRVHASDPRALAAVADADGRFELRGLAPDTPYAVIAVSPGWCVWPPAVLEASDDNLLCMDWVLGIRAVVRERDGRALDLPALRTYGKRLPVDRLELRGARYLPLPNPIAELFGSGESPESGDIMRQEFCFACPDERLTLGPMVLGLDVPGYRRESVELWALPTDHGIQEQALVAVPLAEERRDLSIEFPDVPPAARVRLALRGHLGEIVLVDSQGTRWCVDLHDLSAQSMTLARLPRSLRFDSVQLNAGERLPCRLASLSETVETWSVDLSAVQAVRVELHLPDGSPYLGPATFLTGVSEEELDGMFWFERAPFILLGRRASDLRVFAFEPESVSLEPEGRGASGPDVRLASIDWR